MTRPSPANAVDRSPPTWLLIDPPAQTGYDRRSALREKADAPPAPFPSIDLILTSGRIQQAGYTPRYLDAQISRLDWTALARRCNDLNPAGICALVSSDRLDAEITRLTQLKRAVGARALFIIGSVHHVLAPTRVRQTLEQHPDLDGIILNTAENNLADLIATGHARNRPAKTEPAQLEPESVEPANVALRRDGRILVPPLRVTYGQGFHLPQPVHAVFRDHRYFFPQTKRTPVTCTQLSFGCPYTCEFCLDNAVYRKMHYRSVDDVLAELQDIERAGFRECYFKDLTFGLNKKVTTEFLGRLAATRLNLRWLCTTRVDVATPRLLQSMKAAGCYGIEFGVESGTRHRRAANGKPIDDDAIRTVFHNCRRLGIETTAFVMIGFEDETEDEIRATMRFIESLKPDYASYNVLTALPGTPLHERARKEGFLLTDESDATYATSNIKHKHLTRKQLQRLHAEATASFYKRLSLVARRLLKARSLFELRKLVRLGTAALQTT